MKQLSDLLDQARAGAPPARYDVDDVIAAGRRRQRRTAAGWGAGAVLAVATAVAVPQLLAPAPPGRDDAPVVAATTEPPEPVAFTFAGFTAGKLRVAGPTVWQLGWETASILRSGRDAGSLSVYRPGVDWMTRLKVEPTVTDAEPVHGRKAVNVELTKEPGAPALRQFAWEYADDAWAVIVETDPGMTATEMRQVAEALRATADTRPVTLAFRTGFLPDGYTLISAGSDPKSGQRSMVVLVPDAVYQERMKRPDRVHDASGPNETISISLSTGPAGQLTVPATAECVDADKGRGGSCAAPVPGGGNTEIRVIGGPGVEQSLLRKVLDGTRAADPGKPATWWPVSTAIPASALPAVK